MSGSHTWSAVSAQNRRCTSSSWAGGRGDSSGHGSWRGLTRGLLGAQPPTRFSPAGSRAGSFVGNEPVRRHGYRGAALIKCTPPTSLRHRHFAPCLDRLGGEPKNPPGSPRRAERSSARSRARGFAIAGHCDDVCSELGGNGRGKRLIVSLRTNPHSSGGQPNRGCPVTGHVATEVPAS